MEFLPGSLVLAQSGSFPPWPAKIQRTLGSDQYLVTYYGSHDTEVVPSQALHPYDDRCKQRFCDGSVIEKQGPAFKRAMKEIEENPNSISGPKTKDNYYVRSDHFKHKLKSINKKHDFDETRNCTSDDVNRFVLPGINKLEKKVQPENEKSEYEKIREKNIAEREAALKASGLLDDIRRFRADYINPGNVKKSNPKTSKSSSDTVKCLQCSLWIHKKLIKSHRKFYHDTQMMLPGGMEITRDKGRKKLNVGHMKFRGKVRNTKFNGTSSIMENDIDGICTVQRRKNVESNPIEVVELDKDEVIEIVDDDNETFNQNFIPPGDENKVIEIVDEEEDTAVYNNKAPGMTMEITTADIVFSFAPASKTSGKSGKLEVLTIDEDDKDMGAQYRTSILSQTSYGSFKDSHQSVPWSEREGVPSHSEGVSTSSFITNTGQESTLKDRVTDSSSEEEDFDCTQESSIITRNIAPCNISLSGRRGLLERSRSY